MSAYPTKTSICIEDDGGVPLHARIACIAEFGVIATKSADCAGRTLYNVYVVNSERKSFNDIVKIADGMGCRLALPKVSGDKAADLDITWRGSTFGPSDFLVTEKKPGDKEPGLVCARVTNIKWDGGEGLPKEATVRNVPETDISDGNKSDAVARLLESSYSGGTVVSMSASQLTKPYYAPKASGVIPFGMYRYILMEASDLHRRMDGNLFTYEDGSDTFPVSKSFPRGYSILVMKEGFFDSNIKSMEPDVLGKYMKEVTDKVLCMLNGGTVHMLKRVTFDRHGNFVESSILEDGICDVKGTEYEHPGKDALTRIASRYIEGDEVPYGIIGEDKIAVASV